MHNSKLSKDLKNGIETLIGQVVFKLWIKTVNMLCGSITQNLLACLNADAILSSLENLL